MSVEVRDDRTADRRRRRAVAGVGAAMLIAAAAGIGFGVGRSLGDDESADVVAPVEGAAESDVASASPTDPAPTTSVLAEVAADVPDGTDAARENESAGAVEDETVGEEVVAPPASGGPGWSSWGGPAYTLLYERTTESGLALRASRGEIWDPGGNWGVMGWEPAPWCYPDAELRVTLSGPGVVDVGGASWYSEPVDGQSISWFTMGRADAQPYRVVVVQATERYEDVVVVFDDGATDRAAVVDGVAILVAPGEFADDWYHEGELPILPDGGFDVELIGGGSVDVVGSDEVAHPGIEGYEEACIPPPPGLPDPGDQPADPAAADAAIRAAVDALYDTSREIGNELELLDDATGVEQAVADMQSGSSAELAVGVTADIRGVVFTTPTEAWYRYHLVDADGGLVLRDRYGIAVEIDGSWRITRATLCQDLALAGGDCGSSDVAPYEPVALPPR